MSPELIPDLQPHPLSIGALLGEPFAASCAPPSPPSTSCLRSIASVISIALRAPRNICCGTLASALKSRRRSLPGFREPARCSLSRTTRLVCSTPSSWPLRCRR